ncbi:MAG TPA: acyltransferase [Cyclobacteriaceae bacterium]
MTISQTKYFPPLTGLRALAASMVFFHHANPFLPNGSQRILFLFVNEFHVGVSLFFVLSGFLIYSRYESSLFKTSHWFLHYLQNRFARIYPLYFLLTTLTFAALLITDRLTLNAEGMFIYITNITLLKGFFNELKFTGIGQGWSLTVEECFYFLAPFLFLRWTKLKFIIPVILLLSGSLLVLLFSRVDFYGFFSNFHFMMVYTFFGRCFEFCAGIGLASYLKNRGDKRILWSATYFGLIGILLIISLLTLLGENGNSGLEHPTGVLLNNFILPLAIATFIYGLIKENTWIQKILSSDLASLLGKSSYAFYLIHAGIFFSAIYHYVTQNVFLIFVLLLLTAMALYYFVEKPLNERWKSRT